MFADRTAWTLTPNALTMRQAALRRAGVLLYDLTLSNPTQAGFPDSPELLRPLADPAGLKYEPSPMGLLPAREAVAAWYARQGLTVDPAALVLTASTSEAYSFLFRLLANAGDHLLVPCPSYPLFHYLAQLHDLAVDTYPLRYRDRWAIDLAAVEAAITPATRAVILVQPNNPTGSCLTPQELAAVTRLCAARGLALIADEVFAEYLFAAPPGGAMARALGAPSGALTFTLGGLSKSLGLPQMKVAWMAVSGPPALVREALGRLEVIADTFLSVSTPAQQALPHWLALAPTLQAPILDRVQGHRRWLATRLATQSDVALLAADGGWSAMLRVSGMQDEEAAVLALLEHEQVVIHPGYFFDCEEPGVLVLSLLPPPAVFQEGVARLLRGLEKFQETC